MTPKQRIGLKQMDKKQKIVISGINITVGGAFSVFTDILDELLKDGYYIKNEIIVLVHSKKDFPKYSKFFKIIEFPKSKRNWINRLWYEYIYFYFVSKKLKPDVWISMHDITPNVLAKKKFVYCHNPSPFYKMSLNEVKYGWKYYLFSKFYKYLYRINIKTNNAIIVQQEWMADEFKRMFNVNNIIVAYPELSTNNYNFIDKRKIDNTVFVVPSFPRPFKNFELVCKATQLLERETNHKFEVLITLNGRENNYSKDLYNKYHSVKSIKFCGLLDRQKLFSIYEESDCLIFVSKLETWGMPITEFKETGKPEILADLPYAHESIGKYDSVDFVNVKSPEALANSMLKVIKSQPLGENYVEKSNNYLIAKNWSKLVKLIIG